MTKSHHTVPLHSIEMEYCNNRPGNHHHAMQFRSDFAIVTFDEHLGNTKEDLHLPQGFKPCWVGDQSTIKEFRIEGEPVFGHAYLLVMAYEVHFSGHTVWINNTELPFYDLPPCKGQWLTSIIPVGCELRGNAMNSIQIRRNQIKEDNFIIKHIIVHWRETLNA